MWQGNPGSLSEKTIKEELKKVTVSADQKATKATKALEYAETLIGQKRYLQGIAILDKVKKGLEEFRAKKPASGGSGGPGK